MFMFQPFLRFYDLVCGAKKIAEFCLSVSTLLEILLRYSLAFAYVSTDDIVSTLLEILPSA